MSNTRKKTRLSRTPRLSLEGKASSPIQPESAEMNGNERKIEIIGLKFRQQSVLPILAASPTLARAARESGVAESTLRRWLDDPAFRREVDRLRQESFDYACKQVESLMPMAMSVMAKCMESDDLAVGLRAARSAVSVANQLRTTEKLRAELQELTEAVNATKDASPMK